MSKVTTILIVDDDTDDQELLREAIQQLDDSIRCLSAANGQDALRLLQAVSSDLPDLIFLDLNMPRMNGSALLRNLKQTIQLRDIPVVIYTTSKTQEDLDETQRLGAAQFITKPDSFEGIVAAVAAVLSWEER